MFLPVMVTCVWPFVSLSDTSWRNFHICVIAALLYLVTAALRSLGKRGYGWQETQVSHLAITPADLSV